MRLVPRLLVGSILVVTSLVALVVLLSRGRLRHELEELEVAQLAREARLVAQQWTPQVDADALANASGIAIGHRVTLIRADGHVVGDSDFDPPALDRLENHGHRPEVMAALRDSVGSALRQSPSVGDSELYVAVRAPLGVARVSIATREFDRIVDRAQRDVLLSGLVALAAAIGMAFAFARSVSAPVIELRDVAQALAAGDLSRRPSLSAPGEVGDLAAAVGRMSEQLAARLATLEEDEVLLAALIESLDEGVIAVDARRRVLRLNPSARRLLGLRDEPPFPDDRLSRDRILREALATALAGEDAGPVELTIDGRTLALTARPLRDGGAVLAILDITAARRVDAVRRDFVANVSHELKTPLTVIGGFAETLATESDLDETQRHRFAETIRASAARMQQIVDDLLDLSRIESGGWRPNPAPTDVELAASEVFEARRARATARGVMLSTAIDPRVRDVVADPTALRQVIGNLVDNAIRYTNAGGSVTVFTRAEPGAVSVGVRDTGIGIAPEHLPRLFERFYRVDAARSREAGGTGLGLAIVRHLVEAHGGRVRAESTVGRGTTVTASFPADTNDAPAPS